MTNEEAVIEKYKTRLTDTLVKVTNMRDCEMKKSAIDTCRKIYNELSTDTISAFGIQVSMHFGDETDDENEKVEQLFEWVEMLLEADLSHI